MFGNISGTLLLVTAGLVFVLLVLIYRSPIFWLIPFSSVLFAEATARGIAYLLAKAGVMVNGQSAGILPVLVFGAGTDYALLLVARYREELRRHVEKRDALRVALRRAGVPILASGCTVILALLCLSFAKVNGTSGLGPIAAMGIAVAHDHHAHAPARAAGHLRRAHGVLAAHPAPRRLRRRRDARLLAPRGRVGGAPPARGSRRARWRCCSSSRSGCSTSTPG